MEELDNIESTEVNIENSSVDTVCTDSISTDENLLSIKTTQIEPLPDSDSLEDSITPEPTDIIEYKEIEEPCVALTIIGENRLTDTAVFIKRGFKFSIKAFFSTLVLTIMNLFI